MLKLNVAVKYFAIFDKKYCDNISIAMKDWKYF